MDSVAVTQFGYIGIGASDLAAWEQFATETLGLEVNGRGPDGALFLRDDDYFQRITIHPNGKDDVAYLGWEVPNAGALQAMKAKLQADGVTVADGTAADAAARHVAGLIKLQDPNGIAVEVYYGPERKAPFKSPRGITFLAGDQGFGHCVITVDDPVASEHFYKDLLGMKLSDHIEAEMGPGFKLEAVFFHCNPRHHSLAFAPGVPGMPPGKRLHHFMLQVTSLDVVGDTLDKINAQGRQAMTLGRHTNDHMVSFYLVTPSGFQIEYGWGAREIDDSNWTPETYDAISTWGHVPATPAPAAAGAR